jgi:hypothetical protein
MLEIIEYVLDTQFVQGSLSIELTVTKVRHDFQPMF